MDPKSQTSVVIQTGISPLLLFHLSFVSKQTGMPTNFYMKKLFYIIMGIKPQYYSPRTDLYHHGNQTPVLFSKNRFISSWELNPRIILQELIYIIMGIKPQYYSPRTDLYHHGNYTPVLFSKTELYHHGN
jgi:hypothetical protein